MDSLKNKKEFDAVYKRGQKRYAKYFTLYLLSLNTRDLVLQNRVFINHHFLLGLSISKKVGKATQRNLIKRRVRYLCRKHFEKLQNHALVFVAKNGLIEVAYPQLEQDFLRCLKSFSQAYKAK